MHIDSICVWVRMATWPHAARLVHGGTQGAARGWKWLGYSTTVPSWSNHCSQRPLAGPAYLSLWARDALQNLLEVHIVPQSVRCQ